MRPINIFSVGLCLFSLFLMGCGTNKNILTTNYASTYQKQAITIYPDLSVYHSLQDSSYLYVRLKVKDIFPVYTNNPSIKLKVGLKTFKSYDETTVIDTITYRTRVILIPSGQKYIQSAFLFPTRDMTNSVLQVALSLSDAYEPSYYYIELDKTPYSRQNYHALQLDADYFITNWVTNQPFTIFNSKGYSTHHVTYYKLFEEIAKPPFAFDSRTPFSYQPDSTFQYTAEQEIQLRTNGVYHFTPTASTGKQGYTLYKFYGDFPNITTADMLLAPLRYITTEKEYGSIEIQENRKTAVENFWLGLAGNSGRAKEVLRKYYNRVCNANKLFSSYKEGWKTDRGMIYTIYGMPDIVYKTNQGESWVYGDGNNVLSLTFNFVKVINPFTDNDFILSRSPSYQNNWYTAVDSWRQGRAYNDY